MSSWSCPHVAEDADHCRRTRRPCVPGRPGCVLPDNLRYALPLATRIAQADARHGDVASNDDPDAGLTPPAK
ncbi:MAG: hypothetical protein IT440_14940 [Phycisphaeraceae bacterium]|nr:hypothetical protein [Phycisphaeraceae bacterium]